jgi:chemotaxis protein MotB
MSDPFDESENGESDDDAPTAPFWMTTFSDMMTILMTFFVMIVSMSEVEVKKFKEALSHFQGHPSILTENTSVMPSRHSMTPTVRHELQKDIQYQRFLKYLEENGLEDKVQANRTETGIHVVISDSVMFRTGKARLIEPSRTILRMLARILDKNVTSVVVEGHTDDRPIRTGRFPSNWELSTARAASSVRFLQQNAPELDPSRYAAVGYGAHRPRATNETRAGRAQNRRVEILFDLRSWNDPTNPPPRRLPTLKAEPTTTP